MDKKDYGKVLIMSTPGLGLTVVCQVCKPHKEIITDKFDLTLGNIMQELGFHFHEGV